MTATANWINNHRQLHLQHGPIDLIVVAEGGDTNACYTAAERRFKTILQELVDELPLLRTDTSSLSNELCGTVARRMFVSARSFKNKFTTPMISVAGSVADEVLAAMLSVADPDRAYVNNGGDIAIHLKAGQQYNAGIVSDPRRPQLAAKVTVESNDGIKGIATSGRHGRSLSLGIADAVTVMAESASVADAAATLIANEVNLPYSESITRVAAEQVDPDSDLEQQLVTVEVGELFAAQVNQALDNGLQYARALCDARIIVAGYLTLRGEFRTVNNLKLTDTEEMAYA